MAYSSAQKNSILLKIFEEISNGQTLRSCLVRNSISSQTFFKWVDASKQKTKQYARALELRAEYMSEEILEIADNTEGDFYKDEEGRERVDHENIQRSKLRVDTRKWLMAKMMPKKYGNRLEVEQTGEVGAQKIQIEGISTKELSNLLDNEKPSEE